MASHDVHYVVPVLAPTSIRFSKFTTGNWSGYHANWDSNGYVNWATVDADNDNVTGERKTDYHHVGNWVGFGGIGSGSNLTQAGTDLNDDGSYGGQGKILFFYEYVKGDGTCCNAVDISNISISRTNDVYVLVQFEGSCGTCPNAYSVADFTNKSTNTYTFVVFAQGKVFSNNSVEWEAEDATAGSSGPWTSYNGEEYLSPEVYQSNGTQSFAMNLAHVADWMGIPGDPYYMKPSAFQTDCCHGFYEISQT